MTLPAVNQTARALTYYMRREEVAAHNLANVSTDGFKASRVAAHADAAGGTPSAVAGLDLSQGTIRPTDRPLDVALEGPGFFVVGTPAGERLTRDGGFHLDPAGQLVDAHGSPILGRNGPIVATAPSFEVHEDGTVIVAGAEVDRLRIVMPRDPATLRQEGAGRFTAGDTVDTDPVQTRLRQGALEDANADAIGGLVDLISIQRAYAANIKTLQAMDDVMRTSVNDIGRV